MICAKCRYQPWPCVSCGRPRCYCFLTGVGVYRHYYPVEKVGAPIMEKPRPFPCGHPREPANIRLERKRGLARCRACAIMRWRGWPYRSGRKATPVSGEELARDYLEAR